MDFKTVTLNILGTAWSILCPLWAIFICTRVSMPTSSFDKQFTPADKESADRFLESLTNTANNRIREIDEEQKEMKKIVDRMNKINKTRPN